VSSTLSRLDGVAPSPAAGWRGALGDYCELTKPRIIGLLLVTTVASMVMAARGLPAPWILLLTILGGSLAAGSAGAFNSVIDRDVDVLMVRTHARPVAAGRISPAHALIFATLLGVLSFSLFFVLVNPLAAWLSLAGNLYYVVVYSLLLKRATPWNIVIGGAAGSIPPLVGWAAVTGTIGWPAFALFVAIFLWTPPHFWALALMANTDYARAGIPMLPSVFGTERTRREIIAYSVVMVIASLVFVPLGVFGKWYLAAALVLGAIFLWDAAALYRGAIRPRARTLFRFSLSYLALLSMMMVVDRLLS